MTFNISKILKQFPSRPTGEVPWHRCYHCQWKQAHAPLEMEFYKGTFIHCGLGNLFFDQWTTGAKILYFFRLTNLMPNRHGIESGSALKRTT